MAARASEMWWLFTRQTVSIQPHQEVQDAVKLMVRRGFKRLPVVDDGGRVLGLLSAQEIMDAMHNTIMGSRMVEGSSGEGLLRMLGEPVKRMMNHEPLMVEPSIGLTDAFKKMAENDARALLIVDANLVLQGIVTLRDLVSLMGARSSRLGVRVEEVMTTKPACVAPDQKVEEAVGLMATKKVVRLLVAGPDLSLKGLAGILTSKDILRYLESCLAYGLAKPLEALQANVSSMMSKDVVSVDPDDDVRAAAYLMATIGVGGLVVAKEGDLAIVTERDLIHKLYKLKGADFMRQAINPREDVSDRPSW